MAAHRRSLPLPPRALPLRSAPHRAHIQPSHGASTVRLRTNVLEVVAGGAFPLGAHGARRTHPTRHWRSVTVTAPAERAYFVLCRALGWLLRSAKYSNVRIVRQQGAIQVRKRRRSYAPLPV